MKLSDVIADLKRQVKEFEQDAKHGENACGGRIAEVIRGVIKVLEQVAEV